MWSAVRPLHRETGSLPCPPQPDCGWEVTSEDRHHPCIMIIHLARCRTRLMVCTRSTVVRRRRIWGTRIRARTRLRLAGTRCPCTAHSTHRRNLQLRPARRRRRQVPRPDRTSDLCRPRVPKQAPLRPRSRGRPRPVGRRKRRTGRLKLRTRRRGRRLRSKSKLLTRLAGARTTSLLHLRQPFCAE